MAVMLRALAVLLSTAALAAPLEDSVPFVPGYGVPPAPQWSGYLNASAAEPGTMLHYWLAQAERPDAASLPLVLWLNGGPGSSSIIGMMEEQGPLLINATGGLMMNPYSWTKQANLMVLESPAGVGYSYCAAMLTGGSCSNSDVTTARAARAALQDFFRKFPEYRANRFYITGESYAGVYIPTLTQEIIMNAPEIRMTGIAVGDPCTDYASQTESMDMLWYAHKNGFVPDKDFDFLWNTCSMRSPSFLSQGRWKREAGRWSAAKRPFVMPPVDPALEKKCRTAHRRFVATTSKAISQDWDEAYINELSLFSDAAPLSWKLNGTEDQFHARWMNRADVRKALHVEGSPVKSWPGPPDGWEYNSTYSACNDAPNGTESMINFYRRIAPRLSRTIVFNGDSDPCVSYEGTRVAIEKVGFAVLPGGAYRPWFYNKTAAAVSTLLEKPNLYGPNLELHPAGPQFAGHVVDYMHNLSFATVHGSGHMVPQFRPQTAERLLSLLLSGELFAPVLPTDDQLGNMSDSQFDAFVDDWTQRAKLDVGEKAGAGLPHVFVV